MMNDCPPSLPRERSAIATSTRIGLAGCLAGAVIGALGVIAHWLGLGHATALVEGRPVMAPITAFSLLVAGLAGAMRHRREVAWPARTLSVLGGMLVLVVGVLTVLEYELDADLGVDWRSAESALTGPHCGRPSPLTGLALVPLGAAFMLFDVRFWRVELREWLALAVALVAFVSLVGHAFGAGPMYEVREASVVGVGLPTGLGLLLISLGALLERPQVGIMRLVVSSSPGGVMMRRLGLAAVIAGPLLGESLLAMVRTIGLRDLPLTLGMGVVLAVCLALTSVAITARSLERAYEHLEHTRERLFQLIAQAPDGVFVADLEGRYTEVNEAGCRMLGYSREELVGMRIADLILAEDADRLARSKEQQLKGETDIGQWRLRRKDGGHALVEVSARILRDGRWQAIVRDVTERVRHLEEQGFLARVGGELAACLEAQSVLATVSRLAVNFLGDVCVIDVLRDGVFERASMHHADPSKAQLAAALGRPVPGSSYRSLLWRVLESRSPVVASDASAFRDVASSAQMLQVLEELNACSTMMIPLLARGQLLAVLTIISCVPQRAYGASDLRVAEELARRAALALDNARLYQESRLQAAVTTNLAEGVVLIRQRDQRIVYANPRFEAMFGYGREELIGKPISVVNAPSEEVSPDAKAAEIIAELEREGDWHGELANIKKDGAIVWSQASVSTFQHEVHGTVWIAVHTDITERKRLEETNARALREKEALLREIHHRVKNNLQVISSLFSLQRNRTDNDALRALLDESRGRVQSMALVHEHLYRSTSLADIDFDAYLRGLVASIRGTYGDPRVTLDVRASNVILDADRAVPAALLIGELVSNAFKHAFPGRPGVITIRACRDDQRNYVFEVADDGLGMPEGVDWRTSSSLGLRLVGIFVRQLQGSIELDRSSGTRFVVRFPAEPRRAASVREPPRQRQRDVKDVSG